MNKAQFIIFILSITVVVISAYTIVIKDSCPINETCLDFAEYPNLHLPPVEPKVSPIVCFLIFLLVAVLEYSVWISFGGNFVTFCVYKYATYKC